MNKTGVTLITPTQGNPIALKRTLDSVVGVVDEIIIGDVIVFDEDRELIKSYKKEYNVRIVSMPFNYIFKMGFSSTLNFLASHATNDWVLYLNVGEFISVGKDEMLSKLNSDYNCYYIDHPVEKHRWYRFYNKNEMRWDGVIHEEIIGEHKPYPSPLFTFEDSEKDMSNPFKAKVYNDIKEICYFGQYTKIVDQPFMKGITHEWWLNFAKDNYDNMTERLLKKGNRYKAFQLGDYEMFMKAIHEDEEFENERHESSTLINFQGARKDVL